MPDLNLPPLPPTGGEITGRSAVDVLAEQHRELLGLCGRLTAAPVDRRLVEVLVATLSRHLSAESSTSIRPCAVPSRRVTGSPIGSWPRTASCW